MARDKKNGTRNPLRVNLDDSEITIRLGPPKSEQKTNNGLTAKQSVVIAWILLLVIIYFLGLIKYLSPKTIAETQYITPNIGITYKAPKYLSVGDENVIELSIINLNKSDSFTGTITIKFHDPGTPITAISDKGLSVVIDKLPPGGRTTKSVNIKLLKKPKASILYYYFQMSQSDKVQSKSFYENNRDLHRSYYDKFFITPISYLGSSWAWIINIVAGTSFLGLVGNYFWERFKKHYGL